MAESDREAVQTQLLRSGGFQDGEDEGPDSPADAPSLGEVRAAFNRLLARPESGG
jgi:hypothetical protein